MEEGLSRPRLRSQGGACPGTYRLGFSFRSTTRGKIFDDVSHLKRDCGTLVIANGMAPCLFRTLTRMLSSSIRVPRHCTSPQVAKCPCREEKWQGTRSVQFPCSFGRIIRCSFGGCVFGTNPLPCEPLLKGPRTPLLPSLAEGCQALAGLKLLLTLSLLFSMLLFSLTQMQLHIP